MKRFLILSLLLCIIGVTSAQEFIVRNFRILSNDITAFMNPVRDLNGEACALIKVVGSSDFAFSTPLGILKRQQEVGEIWLYVPKGTRQITIKHPQWGVLRDYSLGTALESRMTYELTLSSPPAERGFPIWSTSTPLSKQARQENRTLPPLKRVPHTSLPWEMWVAVHSSIGKEQVIPGIRIAVMKRHGFYVYGQSNFHLSSPSLSGSCTKDGFLPQENYLPYYKDETQVNHYMILGGGIHRLLKNLYLYEGFGYGKHQVIWETTDQQFFQNEAYSIIGWAAEVGAAWRIRQWSFSAGLQTHQATQWNGNIGIGMFF